MALYADLHINTKKEPIQLETPIRNDSTGDYMVIKLEGVSIFSSLDQAEQIAKAILSQIQQHQLNQMKEGECIND